MPETFFQQDTVGREGIEVPRYLGNQHANLEQTARESVNRLSGILIMLQNTHVAGCGGLHVHDASCCFLLAHIFMCPSDDNNWNDSTV